MCGICGIISADPGIDTPAVARMQYTLSHRGPDGSGDFSSDHICMAMRRLSIIDLKGGWQPLYNEDRSLVLIANGEIYNYLELISQLKKRGHVFRTNSDCETILHLYEEHGTDCIHHLRGMFAFALWDSNRRKAILARDRMGEKPLYIYENGKSVIFASELRSLLKSGHVPFHLDPRAVDLYFHYQYVPEPQTPIVGVHKLDAGHLLLIDIDPWHMQKLCYWRMEDAPELEGHPPTLIREDLEQISELIIRADVPVGVALSGGLDSSAITVLAARKYSGTLHAFCVGYEGRPGCDERDDAKALADYLKIPFHEIELKTEEIVKSFPDLIYWRDDPIADISGHGYFSVMKIARDHNVPVVLQGQGGDELFWGYPQVREAVFESKQKDYLLRKGKSAFFSYLDFSLPKSLSLHHLSAWSRSLGGLKPGIGRFRRHSSTAPDQLVFYDLWPDFRLARSQMRKYYCGEFTEQLDGSYPSDLFCFKRPWPSIEILITKLISQTYLLENGIAQGDRLSMASSVELRLPLVDYRLVETVIGLRKTDSDYRLSPKTWLKEAIKDILPDWVLSRRKRGFEPPVQKWRQALLGEYAHLLDDGYLVQMGILDTAKIRSLYLNRQLADLSFKALVLEIWSRNLLDR